MRLCTLPRRTNVPKRAIKRRIARINHNMTTSVVEVVIHTASRKETLVRTILQLVARDTSGSASTLWEGMLDKRPNAIQVSDAVNAAGAEGDIGDVPQEELFRFRGSIGRGDDTAADPANVIFRDLKSQRKFNADDTLVWSDDASGAVSNLQGLIVTFWKET